MNRPARLILLSLLACLLSAPGAPLDADSLDHMELQGFQTNGVVTLPRKGRQETLPWRIRGQRAQVEMPLYHLQGFQMTLQKEDSPEPEFFLESPRCSYNHKLQQVHGDGPIHLTGPDGLEISGIGFDLYWQDSQKPPRFVLREAVHIQFPLSLVQKEEGAPQSTP
ncbi:MAG: hypothetical protein ACI4SG_03910 [Oligosphaeraceae bacterium]